MKVKLQQLLLVFAVVLFSGTAMGQAGDCDCDANLNPSFTFYSDPDTCEVTFVADAGGDCLTVLEYGWSVDGAPTVSTGTNNIFTQPNIDDIDNMALKVRAMGDGAECEATYNLWTSLFTCENTQPNTEEIVVSKEAYSFSGAGPMDMVYVGATFEWVISITSFMDNNPYQFSEIFLAGTEPCPFTYLGNTLWVNGVNVGSIPEADLFSTFILCLEEGVTEIKMQVQACNDVVYANNTEYTWENCIAFNRVSSCDDFTRDTGPPSTSDVVCDEVRIVLGCPVALTDGFCLEAEDLEANDQLESKLYFKRPFSNATRITGILKYPQGVYSSVAITSSPELPPSWTVSTTDLGGGEMSFTIESSLGGGGASLDFGPGGIRYPVVVTGTLANDLDGCATFRVRDFEFENSLGDVNSLMVDPGQFCSDFDIHDPDYNEAWILLDPEGSDCVGSSGPLTLTADGPFDELDENTTYAWYPGGATTRSINITTPGTYTVYVNDESGCLREASVTVPGCEGECSCETFVPEIVMEIEGCEVDAVVVTPECSNLDWVVYHWIFSNGNTYDGIDPPAQLFVGPASTDPTISVKVKASIGGVICEKELTENPFIPCRGGGDSGKLASIYPNPANDYLNIDLSEIEAPEGKIEILNMQGLLLVSDSFNTRMKSIPTCDVSNLGSGVYLVRIVDANNNVIEIQRLLIK